MLSLPSSVRIYLRNEPTDMRKSFDALAALVQSCLGENPLSGHLFVFRNRRGDRVKILWWDRDGYALWHKRLEQGTFVLPAAGGRIEWADLMMLLEGIDPARAIKNNRYRLNKIT